MPRWVRAESIWRFRRGLAGARPALRHDLPFTLYGIWLGPSQKDTTLVVNDPFWVRNYPEN